MLFQYFCYFVDTISQKLKNNNVFTIAKRNVEGQDMLYQSLKLTNGIWVLAELKIQPNNPNFMVSEHRQMLQTIVGKCSKNTFELMCCLNHSE